MEERAAQKVPVLLEENTILVPVSDLDRNKKYNCPICDIDFIIDLSRRPVKRLGTLPNSDVSAE